MTEEQAQEFAHKHKLYFIETSALDCTNVEEVFIGIITQIANNLSHYPIYRRRHNYNYLHVILTQDQQTVKNGCAC